MWLQKTPCFGEWGSEKHWAKKNSRKAREARSQGGRVEFAQPPAGGPPAAGGAQTRSDTEQPYGPPTSRGPQLSRVEQHISHCEVEGKVPTDLAGGFYGIEHAAERVAVGALELEDHGHLETTAGLLEPVVVLASTG